MAHINSLKHLASKRGQSSTESFNNWLADLQYLASKCNYGTLTDSMIRDQIVEKTACNKLREKLLLERELTLRKTITIARQIEKATQDTKTITGNNLLTGSINKVESNKQLTYQDARNIERPKSRCNRCGRFDHSSTAASCPAKDAKCQRCNRNGHFWRMCKTQTGNLPKARNNYQTVRNIETEYQSEGQNQSFNPDLGVDSVQICQISDGSGNKPDKSIFHSLKFLSKSNSKVYSMLVDTGSAVSIISYRFYKEHYSTIPLNDGQTLVNYDGNPIKVKGRLDCPIIYKKRRYVCEFHVVEHGEPIIGRNVISTVGMHINGSNMKVSQISNVDYSSLFPDVFSEELKEIKGFCHRIRIHENAIPVAKKIRPVPFAIYDKVRCELEKLENSGIIEKVDASDWVHPMSIADKKDGDIRVCCDLRELNKVIIPERYPLPNMNHLFTAFEGCKIFSEIDLRKAYFQMNLAKESRPLTAFITPWGLYQYKRLPMGLRSSSSAFQHMMNSILLGMPRVRAFQDNVIVGAVTAQEHDNTVREVLEKFKKHQITVNKKKSQFCLSELKTLGHKLSDKGLQPDEDKVAAIENMPTPEDFTTLKSLLGLCSYCQNFIPNFATVAEPLRAVDREPNFKWTSEAESALQIIRKTLSRLPLLSIFRPGCSTIVTVDASGYGLGATLMQIQDGHEVIIECCSRTLNKLERKYSVGEREALACIWACEKWHIYLWGNEFLLRTDHQALVTLLGTSGEGRKPHRIARWYYRLMVYNFCIEYKPGSTNYLADTLSRLPLVSNDTSFHDTDKIIVAAISKCAITFKEFQEASCQDQDIQNVIKFGVDGWPTKTELHSNIIPYYYIRNELYSCDGCLFRGSNLLIVPPLLRKRIIDLAHETHQGITRTKQSIRKYYWWPGMDVEIERAVRNCVSCALSDKSAKHNTPPLNPIKYPMGPWQRLAIDIMGPFHTAPRTEQFIFVLADYYTKWVEACVTGNITSKAVINFLEPIFARFGYPNELVTDNGRQFISQEFGDYLRQRNIVQKKTAIYNPTANGFVERMNRHLKGSLQTCVASGMTWKESITQILMTYRNTPQAATGCSPVFLMFGRDCRTKLSPANIKIESQHPKEKIHKRVEQYQGRYKKYYDTINRARFPSIHVGSWVKYLLPQVFKGESKYSQPIQVIEQVGHYTFRLSNKQIWNARKLVLTMAPT